MFETNSLFILFLVLCGIGAAVSAVMPGRRNPMVLSWIASASAIAILLASGSVLLYGHPFHLRLWDLFSFGPLVLQMDRLSALFVFVTALVYLPVSIYSAAYMRQYLGRYSLRSFGIYYHLLFASIVLLLAAADVVTFLFSWQFMSILSYLLVNYKHEDEYNTQAGYLMLAMSEAGALAVALALLLLAGTSGKLDFASLKAGAAGISETVRWAVFLLSFFGFGVKVGLAPSNIWLPRAHPAATGNVSALLSGVILNLGLYGILAGKRRHASNKSDRSETSHRSDHWVNFRSCGYSLRNNGERYEKNAGPQFRRKHGDHDRRSRGRVRLRGVRISRIGGHRIHGGVLIT